MAYEGPTMSLHVTYYIEPSKVDDFLAALKPAYDGVIAEPECIFFEVYQSPDNPGVFKFVENWNCTTEWFMNVQMKKDYYEPYRTVIKDMYAKPMEYQIMERMPGNQWVSIKSEMTK